MGQVTQLTMTATRPDEEGCLGVYTLEGLRDTRRMFWDELLHWVIGLWEYGTGKLKDADLWQADLLWQVVP